AARQDNLFYDFIYRRFFKNIKLILLSESLYNDVCRYISRENVRICANGIPEAENTCKYPKTDIPHVLFLSNLLPDKGIFVLLDAVKILKDNGLKFVCDIIGAETKTIDAATFANEVSNREIEDIIKYHGPKYGTEKETFWKNTSLFVFPSLNECFPLVLLEAMQHGIPVIATDEGGIPDSVEDGKTGCIVPKCDSKALAEKMNYLLTHPVKAEAMGRAGYEKYQKKFQLQIWEKRLCEILTEITK
ncbi:MAG: glycosyltransferase family 4 protein, partial [Prevotellaceae bacterium]|nr:glycosyltransferase family 4 protein [Prevotellaceae bacterium]